MIALCKVAPGIGNIELREVPLPLITPDEVLIKVKSCGICGSDLHIYNWDTKVRMALPVVMGHEFCGIVEEVGQNVHGVPSGVRVTAEPTYSVCNRCRFCNSGFYNLCPDRRVLGFAVDGAFAEYIRVPEKRVHRLPENISFNAGAMIEPLACCIHGLYELSGIRVNEFAVVIGPGAIGLLSVQLLKAAGASVVAVGMTADEGRLSLARELGADFSIDAEREDAQRAIHELTDGLGADVVVECSGSQTAANLALDLVCKRGRYVQIGLFGKPIMLDFEKVAYKEIVVTGSFAQKWSAWTTALSMLKEGKVQLNPMISDVIPLLEWEVGFSKLNEKKGLKVILTP